MSFPAAQRSASLFSAQVTASYFSDLAVRLARVYNYFARTGIGPPSGAVVVWHFARTGIGPPSGAATCGTAADTNVPTSPTIRITILIVRFMGSLLTAPKLSEKRELPRGQHYKPEVKYPLGFISYRVPLRESKPRGEVTTLSLPHP
jgi:hypothetical protein